MGLSAFLKENAILAENVKFVASKRFVEAKEIETPDGKETVSEPIEWEIRAIDSKQDESLRKSCTRKVQVPGRKGQYTNETDYDKYVGKLAVACTVFPNLNDKGLQDNYGAMGADELLKAMLLPGEYAEYLNKVQEICGFDIPLSDMVDEVKN